MWIPPREAASPGERHWISSSGGSSEAMVEVEAGGSEKDAGFRGEKF